MRVAVLGSGNGGLAAAADWSLAGHEVSLFDFERFSTQVSAVALQKGIQVEGEIQGFASVSYSGHSVNEAIADADLILAIGPSFSTEVFANAVKNHISQQQVYVVCPGSYGGALITKSIFGTRKNSIDVIVAETSTLPYAARLIGAGRVKVCLKLRGGLYLATIPMSKTGKVLELFQQVYPCIETAKNIFQTILQNANPIIHPAVTLLNTGLIERTNGDFLFYWEGVTPGVGRLIEALDLERIKIAQALGINLLPDTEMGIKQGYMTEASYEFGYSNAPGFQGIKAQEKLDHRYFNEDVGYGLVFLSDLAKSLGLETPTIDSVINIASTVMKRDYRGETARTLKGMGYTIKEVFEL